MVYPNSPQAKHAQEQEASQTPNESWVFTMDQALN